jgi:hypothetical protein
MSTAANAPAWDKTSPERAKQGFYPLPERAGTGIADKRPSSTSIA